jgi:hypothetical protein
MVRVEEVSHLSGRRTLVYGIVKEAYGVAFWMADAILGSSRDN